MTDAENKDIPETGGCETLSGPEPEDNGSGRQQEQVFRDGTSDRTPQSGEEQWQSQVPPQEQEQWQSVPAASSAPGQQAYDNPPYGSQPYNGQSYNSQPYGDQPYNGQPYNSQPYGDQPYNGQSYNSQPYGDQPYNGQSYNSQPYGGQPYNGQSYNSQPYGGQPYNGQPYNSQPYGDQPYNGQPYNSQPYGSQPQPKQKNKFATLSLVCGIIGLLTLCCCAFPLAIIMGAGAICFAVISKKEMPLSGPAIAGIILGIICVLLGIGEFIYVMAFSQFMNDPENAAIINEIYEQMEQQLQ